MMVPTGALVVVGMAPRLVAAPSTGASFAHVVAWTLREVAVYGGTLFVQRLPAQPDTALAVLEQPRGTQRPRLVDPEPAFVRALVLVRGTTFVDTVDLATTAAEVIRGLSVAFEVMYWQVTVGTPRPMGRDRRRRVVYALDVSAEREP